MKALVPVWCVLPALAALSSAAAQDLSLPQGAPAVRTLGPIERVVHITYDVALERIRTVRESSPNEFALGTPPCFDNSEPSGVLVPATSVVANPGEDLLSWGTKRCSGASLLRGFTIAYISSALSLDRGGPGAAFSIALYSGATGFGQPGTEIFRHTFSGLPAGPGLVLYFLTLDFTTDPLPLADGPFGWSYLQIDSHTGPILVEAPKPILGTRDALDIYGPGPARPSNYIGTFNYGGCQVPGSIEPCACTWMQLDEILTSELALSAELNGSGVNPQILHEYLPARLGHVWSAGIDVTLPSPPRSNVTALLVSNALGTPQRTRYGEILIDLSQPFAPPIFGEAAYNFAIPASRALVGRRLYMQAALLPPLRPRIELTNALRVRIGY